MKRFILDSLQSAFNQYLALDPESHQRIEKLHGKIVTLELLGLGLICQLSFQDKKMKIILDHFAEPHTIIKSPPLTLLRMSLTDGDRKHFFKDNVSIEGNLEIGQEVIDLFDQLEIDWEEYLSQGVGDVAAHQIGRFARKLKNISERTRETMCQNINEYVHEEINLTPTSEILQDFFSDIDELRMDVDRMAARIKLLQVRQS